MYDFSVDYRAFDTSNIIDIYKDLMKKHHDIKQSLGKLKKISSHY